MTAHSKNQPAAQAPEKDECIPLDELVENLSTSAAAGEFDKSAKDKLAEIAKGVDATLQSYKDPLNGHDALVARWKKQDEQIAKIREHLEQCYPNWDKRLCECVCKEVIWPIHKTRTRLRRKLGLCEKALEDSTYCFDQASKQLDAWKDITGWLKKRLDDNHALIDEICKLDNCEDHAFALYIFYFQLLRPHSLLMPGDTDEVDRYDPVRYYCQVEIEPCCELECFPWIIDPDKYKGYLDRVACRWREAGIKKAAAEANVALIDELRKRLSEESDPEKKRNKAKQCLKNTKPGAGDGEEGDAGGTQRKKPQRCPPPDPDPSPDPCEEPEPKPEPCPEPEPEPEPEPKPDPCPEPEPKPDPCDDPDPSYPNPTQQRLR